MFIPFLVLFRFCATLLPQNTVFYTFSFFEKSFALTFLLWLPHFCFSQPFVFSLDFFNFFGLKLLFFFGFCLISIPHSFFTLAYLFSLFDFALSRICLGSLGFPEFQQMVRINTLPICFLIPRIERKRGRREKQKYILFGRSSSSRGG